MKEKTTMKYTFCLLSLVVLTGAGRAQDKVQPNDLKQIGLAYHNFVNDNNRGPKDAAALAPYFDNNKKLLEHLTSKRIEFFFGVGLNDLKQAGISNTILAYEKDAP